MHTDAAVVQVFLNICKLLQVFATILFYFVAAFISFYFKYGDGLNWVLKRNMCYQDTYINTSVQKQASVAASQRSAHVFQKKNPHSSLHWPL